MFIQFKDTPIHVSLSTFRTMISKMISKIRRDNGDIWFDRIAAVSPTWLPDARTFALLIDR